MCLTTLSPSISHLPPKLAAQEEQTVPLFAPSLHFPHSSPKLDEDIAAQERKTRNQRNGTARNREDILPMDETIRQLVEKNMESIVSIRVVKKIHIQAGGGPEQLRAEKEEGKDKAGGSTSGSGEREKHRAGKDDAQDKTGGTTGQKEPLAAVSYGTGSIIHCCDRLAVVLSCAHPFEPSRVRAPQPAQPLIDRHSEIQVQFFDGYTATGFLTSIGWSHEVSLVVVLMRGATRIYKPVKFVEHSSAAMGFPVYGRETPLYSISTFPTAQHEALFGTVQAGKISGPPRLGRDIDPDLAPELKIFQFQMDGADGCSGAPIFTQSRQVMGIWISHVGDFKFGILVHSLCDWLRRTFNIEETSMKLVVAKVATRYTTSLMQVEP